MEVVEQPNSTTSSLIEEEEEAKEEEDDQVLIDLSPLIRIYKGGRVKRLMGTATVPPSSNNPHLVSCKDVTTDDVSARLYLPTTTTTTTTDDKKLPILVYYHGGAFCIESAFSPTYQPFLHALSSRANILIVSVNYRLAPEHPLPAAYHDSWAALRWLFSPTADPWVHQHGDTARVFLAGDSAGANICHQMAIRAADDHVVRIKGMALVHPYFWGLEPVGEETRDPVIRDLLERLWGAVNAPGMGSVDDPRVNPSEGELAGIGCRKVMVCVAERDVLAERGRLYYRRLKESGWGGEAEMFVSRGEDHVFHLIKGESERAEELVDKLASFFF